MITVLSTLFELCLEVKIKFFKENFELRDQYGHDLAQNLSPRDHENIILVKPFLLIMTIIVCLFDICPGVEEIMHFALYDKHGHSLAQEPMSQTRDHSSLNFGRTSLIVMTIYLRTIDEESVC